MEISPIDQLLKELREVEQEISRIERETPLKIQRTLDQVQQEITNLERDLWDKLKFELGRLDQQRYEWVAATILAAPSAVSTCGTITALAPVSRA